MNLNANTLVQADVTSNLIDLVWPGLLVALVAGLIAFFVTRILVGGSGRVFAVMKRDPIPFIVAGCAAVLAFYGLERALLGSSVHVEVVKTILQLLLVIVLGGAVTALYQSRLQRRADEESSRLARAEITERDRQMLAAMHDNLVSAYNKAKRARRLMRARLEYPAGDSGPLYVPKSVYDEQMEAVIDAELNFESILRHIESNVPLFGKDSPLDGCIDEIEAILTRTVKEYRRELRSFEGNPPRRSLSTLPELEAFLGLTPGDGGAAGEAAKRRFRDLFNDAIQFLRTEINKRARRINRTESILWVDDQPRNNRYEIDQLGADGYRVTVARSTEEAVEKLPGVEPMLIISDMGRTERGGFRPTAGLDLLERVRATGMEVPIYFYTSHAALSEHRDAVLAADGNGITDSRLQLFRFIDGCAEAVERTGQSMTGAEAPAL